MEKLEIRKENDAMLKVASILASENGMELVSKEKIWAKEESFWGNLVLGIKDPGLYVENDKYLAPGQQDEKRPDGIDIDMYWGRPRLNVRINGKAVHVTYKDGKFSEGQVFGEEGCALFSKVVEMMNNSLINP